MTCESQMRRRLIENGKTWEEAEDIVSRYAEDEMDDERDREPPEPDPEPRYKARADYSLDELRMKHWSEI